MSDNSPVSDGTGSRAPRGSRLLGRRRQQPAGPEQDRSVLLGALETWERQEARGQRAMHWLKGAVSKIRENSGALKEKASQVAVEKAHRARRGHADLSELEHMASVTRSSPAAVADLHSFWLKKLATAEERQPQAGEQVMSFKAMLLKSRALELTFEVIASEPELRQVYLEPPQPEDLLSPVALAYELVTKTLSCPTGVFTEVFRLACARGTVTGKHISWLGDMVTALKLDWEEEELTASRHELQQRVDHLMNELQEAEEETEPGEQVRRRQAASIGLLQAYAAIRRNFQDWQEHEAAHLVSETSQAEERIQSYISELQVAAETNSAQQKLLEGELKQSWDKIMTKLGDTETFSAEINQEVKDLEEQRRSLEAQLEEVMQKLEPAYARRRRHEERCQQERLEFGAQTDELRLKIEAANEAAEAASHEEKAVESMRQLVSSTSASLREMQLKQVDRMRTKQADFDSDVQDFVEEHLKIAEDQCRYLRERATHPQHREDVAKVAASARDALESFRIAYGMLLHHDEEAKVTELEAEFAAIVNEVCPGATRVSPSAAAAARGGAAASSAVPLFTPAARQPLETVSVAPATPPKGGGSRPEVRLETGKSFDAPADAGRPTSPSSPVSFVLSPRAAQEGADPPPPDGDSEGEQ